MLKARFQALDIMRGLTLALMILVNTPGSWSYVYAPLLHADWHGFTPTDFIFPFFLFMVGAALFFSQRSLMQAHISHWQRQQKIIKRTVLLFLVGIFLNAFPFLHSFEQLRFLGVLQRIALAYGLAAFIILYAGFGLRLFIAVAILLGYWAVLQLSTDPYSLENSLVRKIDLTLLGAEHLWNGKGIAFDPEGLLSTLPSVVNVLIGFEVARFLSVNGNSFAAQKKIAMMSLLCISVALLWGMYFPINKSLWTSSFVLLTSGVGVAVLLMLTVLEKNSIAKPVLQLLSPFGKNPLFIYALSNVWTISLYTLHIGNQNSYDFFYSKLCLVLNAYNASLAFAFIHVLIFWCIAKWMDKKGIVISL